MAIVIPASRVSFGADRSWGGTALVAGSLRGVAEWQNHAYARDLTISPCDPRIFVSTEGNYNWQVANCFRPATKATYPWPSEARNVLGFFTLPAPRTAVSGITMWFWVKLQSSAATGTIYVVNETTGVWTPLALTYAACGSVTTGAWLSVAAAGKAGDLLSVRITSTNSGVWVACEAFSGYWNASALWDDSAPFSAVSQTFAIADRPLDSHLIRHMMKACNRFAVNRSAGQVVASFLGRWACGNQGGWDAANLDLGRYKVLVGEGISELTISINAKADTAASRQAKVYVDGVLKATITVAASAAYSENTATLALTPTTSATVREVSIEWVSAVSSFVLVAGVSIWESVATLTLPGAETVPGAYVGNDSANFAGKSGVRAAAVAQLVANEAWLWKYRGLRSLVCESRYTPSRLSTDSAASIQAIDSGDVSLHALKRFPLLNSAAANRVRVLMQAHPINQYSTGDCYWNRGGTKTKESALALHAHTPELYGGTTTHGDGGWTQNSNSADPPIGALYPYSYPLSAAALVPTASTAGETTYDVAAWAEVATFSPHTDEYPIRPCGSVVEQQELTL